MNALIVFVKYPEPGKVKTRLGAEIGLECAAELYELFMRRTFELCQIAGADKVYVAYEPKECQDQFAALIPEEFEQFSQEGDSLGERLQNAFQLVFNKNVDKVMALGSDSPTLPVNLVKSAFDRLDSVDLVLGPAEDGGYYLIGCKAPHPSLFQNIHWSSSSVLQSTLRRAQRLNLSYCLLPEWYDVDDRISLRRAIQDDESGRIGLCFSRHSERSSD
ncbi:MAG: TIGR04282 family arsenosugar biosynthesis glycosyltransferase [bacterium]